MKRYISESRAIYEDMYHGQFSKRLAEWAINHMMTEDSSGTMKKLVPVSADDVQAILNDNDVQIDDECYYTAWYLFNMAKADYRKSIPSDKARALYVEETLNDPDGHAADTLDCFVTKMCNAGIPIYWEMMI